MCHLNKAVLYASLLAFVRLIGLCILRRLCNACNAISVHLAGQRPFISSLIEDKQRPSTFINACFDARLRIVDGHTQQIDLVTTPHMGRMWTVRQPEPTWAATTGDEGLIVLWDARNWKVVHTIGGHVGRVSCLEALPTNSSMLVASTCATDPRDSDGSQLIAYDIRRPGQPLVRHSTAAAPLSQPINARPRTYSSGSTAGPAYAAAAKPGPRVRNTAGITLGPNNSVPKTNSAASAIAAAGPTSAQKQAPTVRPAWQGKPPVSVRQSSSKGTTATSAAGAHRSHVSSASPSSSLQDVNVGMQWLTLHSHAQQEQVSLHDVVISCKIRSVLLFKRLHIYGSPTDTRIAHTSMYVLSGYAWRLTL